MDGYKYIDNIYADEEFRKVNPEKGDTPSANDEINKTKWGFKRPFMLVGINCQRWYCLSSFYRQTSLWALLWCQFWAKRFSLVTVWPSELWGKVTRQKVQVLYKFHDKSVYVKYSHNTIQSFHSGLIPFNLYEMKVLTWHSTPMILSI